MPRRSALLVIDMANDFLFEPGTIATAGGPDYRRRAQAVIPRLARLLVGARAAGIQVIYATDAHQPDDRELAKWPPHAMKGTNAAEIPAPIAPRPEDIVLEKRTYSPFLSTDLEAQLQARGITRLYVAGLHTDCCARHTSGDAFQKGYELVWVTDALQAFTEEAHQAGLEYFKTWYATAPERQFRTTEALLEEWMQQPVSAARS